MAGPPLPQPHRAHPGPAQHLGQVGVGDALVEAVLALAGGDGHGELLERLGQLAGREALVLAGPPLRVDLGQHAGEHADDGEDQRQHALGDRVHDEAAGGAADHGDEAEAGAAAAFLRLGRRVERFGLVRDEVAGRPVEGDGRRPAAGAQGAGGAVVGRGWAEDEQAAADLDQVVRPHLGAGVDRGAVHFDRVGRAEREQGHGSVVADLDHEVLGRHGGVVDHHPARRRPPDDMAPGREQERRPRPRTGHPPALHEHDPGGRRQVGRPVAAAQAEHAAPQQPGVVQRRAGVDQPTVDVDRAHGAVGIAPQGGGDLAHGRVGPLAVDTEVEGGVTGVEDEFHGARRAYDQGREARRHRGWVRSSRFPGWNQAACRRHRT